MKAFAIIIKSKELKTFAIVIKSKELIHNKFEMK